MEIEILTIEIHQLSCFVGHPVYPVQKMYFKLYSGNQKKVE